jgi:hypothetical protein
MFRERHRPKEQAAGAGPQTVSTKKLKTRLFRFNSCGLRQPGSPVSYRVMRNGCRSSSSVVIMFVTPSFLCLKTVFDDRK